MATNKDIICKCKHDMDYHLRDGCYVAGCKCIKKGKTYREMLHGR